MRIVEAKLFMDEHYYDNININVIAAQACFSNFHFLRLFRQTYGLTPHKYLTNLRVRKAKKLLQEGVSVTETCFMLGFSSMSSFNRLFKRYTSVAPLVYATSLRKLQADIIRNPLSYVPPCFIEYMHWDK